MDVLLTWVGSRDPGWQNPRTNQYETGPILTLLRHHPFDVVYLLFTISSQVGDFSKRATDVLRTCERYLPNVRVVQRPVDLLFVTDYREVYRVTNDVCQKILATEGRDEREYFVHLSPGTPQMQTAWILLVQSGLLPARMIESVPPDLAAPGMLPWCEVDLSLPDFPQVVNPGETARLVGVLQAQNENLLSENRRLRAELELLRSGPQLDAADGISDGFQLREYLRAQEYALYVRALEQAGGNGAEAARLLGIEPAAFRARAASLGIRQRRGKSDHRA